MKNLAERLSSPLLHSMLAFVFALGVWSTSSANANVFVSVAIAPPAIPVYVQPLCPTPGYVWIPGYWAWAPDGYYWVPGYWAAPPFVGALWTPGWWGWSDSAYIWHAGYWGPHVGFYGGINYGFGYFGVGYVGGYWRGDSFYYNTAVNNVNVNVIHNTYNRTVTVQNTNVTRVSYNGGAGGVTAQPTTQDRIAERDRHREATSMQLQHERSASLDRGQFASVNHGTPSVTATPRANFRSGSAAATGTGAPRHEQRAQTSRPQTQAQGSQEPRAMHQGAPQGRPEARVERGERGGQHQGGAPHPSQANREMTIDHGAPRASNAPRTPQVSREARIETRHAPSPPQANREPRNEPRAQAFGGPPHAQNTRPETHAQTVRPEMRAQAPRPEMRAPNVRSETRAQAAPQGPGREVHAESRGGHEGGQHREDNRGG